MAGRQYEHLMTFPKPSQIHSHDNGRLVFNGMMVRYNDLGYDMTMGHQFVTKPFVSNNPTHVHNFQEFLAWYGGNPNDPEDFGGEVELYMGMELEKYVFTKPVIVSLPEGLPHCPMAVTRIDRPIIQVEIMLIGADAKRDPVAFDESGGKKMNDIMNDLLERVYTKHHLKDRV
jgi:hypothetical protein